jgi:protein-S-isoprenylcysteine O-methyltransferase Ste14
VDQPGQDPSSSTVDRRLVAAQVVLEAVIVLGAPAERLLRGAGFTLLGTWLNVLVGGLLVLIGLVIASRARRDLGRSFSSAPTPVQSGTLVDTGIYARLRHPMYLGIIVGAFGWTVLWGSWVGLAGSAVMTIFLALKARWEERLLERRYPGYADYRARVRGAIFPRP